MTCSTPFAAIWQLSNCPQCGGDPREHALREIGALRNVEMAARRAYHLNRAGVGLGKGGTHPDGGPCLICDALAAIDECEVQGWM